MIPLKVISLPVLFPGEAVLLNQLFEAGLECLHLRKPDAATGDMEFLLNGVEPRYYDRITLHQHHSLAPAYRIKGLHFPEADRQQTSPAILQRFKDKGYRISTSLHAVADLPEAGLFDYVFLGPVFDSISKAGYKGSNFCLKGISKTTTVIALGGVTAAHIDEVMVRGFDGIAVLGAIWQHQEQAVEQFNRLKELCQHVHM